MQGQVLCMSWLILLQQGLVQFEDEMYMGLGFFDVGYVVVGVVYCVFVSVLGGQCGVDVVEVLDQVGQYVCVGVDVDVWFDELSGVGW